MNNDKSLDSNRELAETSEQAIPKVQSRTRFFALLSPLGLFLLTYSITSWVAQVGSSQLQQFSMVVCQGDAVS